MNAAPAQPTNTKNVVPNFRNLPISTDFSLQHLQRRQHRKHALQPPQSQNSATSPRMAPGSKNGTSKPMFIMTPYEKKSAAVPASFAEAMVALTSGPDTNPFTESTAAKDEAGTSVMAQSFQDSAILLTLRADAASARGGNVAAT
jgi:hypothetical protein